jgi:Zn-dependent protease with chaperone function
MITRSRRSELAADRYVAQPGLAAPLADAMQRLQHDYQHVHGPVRLISRHPDIERRLTRLRSTGQMAGSDQAAARQ